MAYLQCHLSATFTTLPLNIFITPHLHLLNLHLSPLNLFFLLNTNSPIQKASTYSWIQIKNQHRGTIFKSCHIFIFDYHFTSRTEEFWCPSATNHLVSWHDNSGKLWEAQISRSFPAHDDDQYLMRGHSAGMSMPADLWPVIFMKSTST